MAKGKKPPKPIMRVAQALGYFMSGSPKSSTPKASGSGSGSQLSHGPSASSSASKPVLPLPSPTDDGNAAIWRLCGLDDDELPNQNSTVQVLSSSSDDEDVQVTSSPADLAVTSPPMEDPRKEPPHQE